MEIGAYGVVRVKMNINGSSKLLSLFHLKLYKWPFPKPMHIWILIQKLDNKNTNIDFTYFVYCFYQAS